MGPIVTGRHIRLEPTKFELLLKDGLMAMQVMKDRETALRLFRRASAIEPGNHLPYLYLAHITLDSPETLMKAVELNPSSLKARIMLGDAFDQRGNTLEALRCFSSAADVFSEYEIPYSKAASLLVRIGQGNQAGPLSEKAASLFVQGPHPGGKPGRFPTAGLHH